MNLINSIIEVLYILGAIIIITWMTYYICLIALGIFYRKEDKVKDINPDLPKISLIIPARNEERVIGRLLNAIITMKYPKEKLEAIVVIDGSNDSTNKIVNRYAIKFDNIKIQIRSNSNGKPEALNSALPTCTGSIIGVLDADSVPRPDMLIEIAKAFQDPKIIAVQCSVKAINKSQNILTQLVSFERDLWFLSFLKGKKRLNLYIPPTGNGFFIRKYAVERIGGWNSNSLAEDAELGLRLLNNGYKVHYMPKALIKEEVPPRIKSLITQRLRWYRGYIEASITYLPKVFKKPSLLRLDAEFTTLGPLILILSLWHYLISWVFIFSYAYLIALLMVGLTTISFIFMGSLLIFYIKPRRVRNILLLPAVYFYWLLQSLVSLCALILIIGRRPKKWVKTIKEGYADEL